MLGHKNTECHFSSGGNIEEIGHESNLSANIAYLDPFNLSLPDHVHGLITADGHPRRVETEEAESGIDCEASASLFAEASPFFANPRLLAGISTQADSEDEGREALFRSRYISRK